MTPAEKAVAKAFEAARKSRECHAVKIECALVELLKVGCTHPEEYRGEYRWEHDNGYGRQRWVTGDRCGLCGAKRAWKGHGVWIRP